MNTPTYVSIGIPFYNAEKYLADAICSVLAQTHQYWELILVDDGSTDNSLQIAKSYARMDERIRVLFDGKNKKLPNRLNEIIDVSNYDYIARMDADDLMSNNRIEIQLQTLMSHREIDLVTTGYLTIGEDNELTGVKLGDDYQMSAKMILNGLTNLLHASLLARKSWYLRNHYNENSILAEDYDLWLQAAKNNDLNYRVLETPLYWYRVTENVTLVKIIKGYNTQIGIIENNYKGIITRTEKNKIIAKFKLKKLIVKSLDKLNLLKVLLRRRSSRYDNKDIKYYQQHFANIVKMRLEK